MNFYLKGKKITQKAAKELFGTEDIKRKVKEAKESWSQDPYTEISWYTQHGIFLIEFK